MRGGALGDFILGLPALRALRQAFPRAHLELIAPGAVLPLAASLVDLRTPLERGESSALFGDPEALPARVAQRFQELDLVVLWMVDRDGSLRRSFHRLGARRLLCSPALPQGSARHAADHLLDSLEPLGIRRSTATLSDPPPLIHPSAEMSDAAAALWSRQGFGSRGPMMAVHPGSGGVWKTWPPERFARVVEQLRASGTEVALIQGPADEASVQAVMAAMSGDRPPVVSGLDVVELAALLARFAGYLGNDSGVTHLAAAMGVPTVALFGPTDPRVWAPLGPRVTVLRSGVPCSPCSRETAVACRDRRCLISLGVQQVSDSIR